MPPNRLQRPAHIALFNIPEHGHINPTLAIVAELVRRGHRVSYPTTEEFAHRVAETGATPLLYRSTLPSASSTDQWPTDLARGLALFLDEAMAVVPGQLATFEQNRPDLVLYDIAAHGARVLAQHWNVPSVQLSPTHAIPLEKQREFNNLYSFNEDWVAYRARFRQFLDTHAMSLSVDEYLSAPERCMVMIPREFQFRPETLSDRYIFVGPSFREGDSQGVWQPPAADRKVLYISLGTCYANHPEFYRECIEAFAGLEPWHVVLSVGARFDPTVLGELPSHVEVHRSVPQLDVLARSSAFITHGGMGSVLEALFYGVPMVVVPQAVDQPMNARQIEKLGLGSRLSPKNATARALREAVLSVSSAPEVTDRLKNMQRVILDAGGAMAAADVIEECVPRRMSHRRDAAALGDRDELFEGSGQTHGQLLGVLDRTSG